MMRCTCDDIVDDNGCFEPPCPIHGNQNQPDLPTRLRELAEEMRECAKSFNTIHFMAENLEEWSYDVDGTADEIAADRYYPVDFLTALKFIQRDSFRWRTRHDRAFILPTN